MYFPELLPQPSPLLPETASTTSPAATRSAKNSGDRLSAHACRSITPKSSEIPRIASRRMSWMMPRSSELALRIVTLKPVVRRRLSSHERKEGRLGVFNELHHVWEPTTKKPFNIGRGAVAEADPD